MKWRVMVEVTGEDGAVTRHVISGGERTGAGQAATLGLSLSEGKATEADRQVRQLHHVLRRLGATATTPVIILRDGAEGPRSLGAAASVGPIRNVLDWFQLSMRVQHVAQAVKGWATAVPAATERTTMLADAVTRLRWRLGHGQTERALSLIGALLAGLDASLKAADSPPARKVATPLRAPETYVAGQADLIIDYAAARHRGEPISTATTESTVQRLRHRRMGTNQQMRRSPRGAHRMLKVRTAVMNGTLAADHQRWVTLADFAVLLCGHYGRSLDEAVGDEDRGGGLTQPCALDDWANLRAFEEHLAAVLDGHESDDCWAGRSSRHAFLDLVEDLARLLCHLNMANGDDWALINRIVQPPWPTGWRDRLRCASAYPLATVPVWWRRALLSAVARLLTESASERGYGFSLAGGCVAASSFEHRHALHRVGRCGPSHAG